MAPSQFSDDRTTGKPELDALLSEIAAEAEMTGAFTGRPELDPRVMAAMAAVPRERFVDPGKEEYAYLNLPLPIGYGQTISQPFIVALMTDLIRPAAHHVVLEIGTGSGYQTAVLSLLVHRVYSIEVIPELAERAAERLTSLDIDNVEVRIGNGAEGWPEHAPFDGIMVTAAAAEGVPPKLIEQLAPGGRMVIPVGGLFAQNLVLVERDAAGTVTRRNVLPVAFVPLIG